MLRAGYDEVVCRGFTSRRGVYPYYLELGSRGVSLRDDREFVSNGTGCNLLWPRFTDLRELEFVTSKLL